MKKLIVLPGNSPKNKQWGEGVVSHFGVLFDEVYSQDYDHWENGEEVIDFERETQKLKEVVEGEEEGVEYYIIAKSYGSVLALMAIHQNILSPKKCVFFGMPLNLLKISPVPGQNLNGQSLLIG